jgi:NAD(P)-dependent dehydrogenase (short-subunit alcohol dehydrogenase family)
MVDLSGRVVVITGAARGIGQALARAFWAEGARVVALDLSWHDCREFAAALTADGTSMTADVDITDRDGLKETLRKVLARYGTVDVLVNNAALRQRNLYPPTGVVAILDTTDDEWAAMLEVNVMGTLRTTRVFIEPMLAQRRGSIINVGSRGTMTRAVGDNVWVGGHPKVRNQPYDASKAALSSLTFYLAEEVRDRNVAVNLLLPGATRTTGSDAVIAGRRARGIPTHDLLRPEHVVPVALHLARQEGLDGESGFAVDALRWNARNGFGEPDHWRAAG